MSAELHDIEEESCRICRCGVEEGKLFHPCLCRGSVKYVHSDCLKEWLNSSKREKKCDICKAKYRFKPLIPDDAPESLSPVIVFKELVVRNVKYYFGRYLGLIVTALLYVLVLPMTVMCTVRFYSFLVDAGMPKNDISRSLLSGNLNTLDGSFAYNWPNLWECFKYSYPTGLKLVFTVVIIVLQLFVLHEWVTTDQGFQDLIDLQVGDEKISVYVDLFIRDFLQQQFPHGVPNASMTRHELEELVELHELSFRAQMRSIAVMDVSDEQLERDYEKAKRQAYEKLREIIPFIDNLNDVDLNNMEQPIVAEGFEELNFENHAHQHNNNPAVLNLGAPPAPALLEVPFVEDDDEEGGGGFGFGFNVEIHIDIPAGIRTFVVAVGIFLVVFVFLYYFPSIIGTILSKMIAGTVLFGVNFILNSKLAQHISINKSWTEFFFHYIQPWIDEVNAVYYSQTPVSITGRIIPLVTDLILFYIVSGIAMHYLERSFRTKLIPLKGIGRRIYYILFDIRSVLKVNTIFATEIVAFPVFCGFLLDFISSPIFIADGNFFSRGKLFTSEVFFNYIGHDRFLLFVIYWMAGTVYMCLFATYVGMIRKFILRPGVLFFIRSPDDQNTRLIHDALVRPFGLQMSRIFLSGAVYTAFILFGFGVITFPMRYFTSLLPLKFNLISTFTITAPYVLHFKLNKTLSPVIRKFVRIYWYYAIKNAAHLTKMSSFILGIDDVRERGTVRYRSLWHKFFGSEEPDFENPVDEDDLKHFFIVNPDINCLFVPDGYWIKAPDNDNVSRLYLRNLFYPVRSDGSDFENVQFKMSDRKIDNLLGEKDEINEIRSHTVVFRPPNFGARNFLFVALLWLFASLLILVVVITSNIVGYPASRVIGTGGKFLPNWTLNLVGLGFFDDHQSSNLFQLSFTSIVFGIVIELYALKQINKTYKINKIQALKLGKPLYEDWDIGVILYRHFENSLMNNTNEVIGKLVKLGLNTIKRLSFVIASFIWAFAIIFIHKYLIVAILSPDGLSKDKLANDVRSVRNLDYETFTPLVKIVLKNLGQDISNCTIVGFIVELIVSLFTITPFVLALRADSYRSFFEKFKLFMRPQISSILYLALYSVFRVASIIPGLSGNLSSNQWEISFGFALFYYIYQNIAIFHNEVILKKEEEMRNLYYATGEVLMNYEEGEVDNEE